MVRVAEVRRRSIGAELGIAPGTALLRINGREVRDALDLQFLAAEERVELETEDPDGERTVYEIEKEYDEPLGLVPEPEKVRRCTNACPFCFVKGNPGVERLRPGLYVKDDDYRLSFLHGHYVTLTNLREEDWERIREQRLSPLYVSVHATDPDVRLAMLKNPRAAEIHAHLDRLADAGVRIHAQVVLCPGWNDGPQLRRTVEDLYARGDDVLSLSIVPVGLTRYNADRGVRPLTPEESREALAEVERARRLALAERGRGWCYAADELFLAAGEEVPGEEYFDDPELIGNGVGALSWLATRVRRDLGRLPPLGGQRIVLATGVSMGPLLRRLAGEVAGATGARVETVAIENRLYGPGVTTAGLLAGRDYRDALLPYRGFDRALFTRSALNDDGLFVDDVSVEELQAALEGLEVCPSEHITDTLIRV